MTKQRHCKSLNCGQLYRLDPRNLRHQRYCSAPAGRKASQARWLSKPQNRNYFRSPKNHYNFKPVVLVQFHAVDSNQVNQWAVWPRMEFLRPTGSDRRFRQSVTLRSNWHCQVNRNLLFYDAKSSRANTTNQRLRWHADQWNLQEIS